MKKRNLVFALAILLFAFIMEPVSTFAKGEPNYFTIEGYEVYLEGLISTNDPSAELAVEALAKFKELDVEEKEAFLKFLKSAQYTEVLTESMVESDDMDLTVEIDGTEVPVHVEFSEVPGAANISPFSTGDYTLTAAPTYKLYTFGIHTTTLSTTLVYKSDGYKATKTLDAYHRHSNVNPGLWIQYSTSEHYVDGLYAYGRATYEFRATATGGAYGATMTHTIRARWSGHKHHKLDSDHLTIDSFGWTSF